MKNYHVLLLLLWVVVSSSYYVAKEKPKVPPNILFIAIDDLRPQLGCYGDKVVYSPNIDQLAADGFLFEHAYCNVPVCGASRASLLTGLRPLPDRFLDYNTYANEDAPEATTLPQHFKENGYHTLSLGKIFHHLDDKQASWSEPAWQPEAVKGGSWRNYLLPENITLNNSGETRGLPYEKADVPDEAYFDGKISSKAIEKLQYLSKQEKPFFMAVGFLKPHLPFNAPAKYWDLYEEEDITLTDTPLLPKDAPKQAYHGFGELRHYAEIPKEGPVSEEMARKLVHGYYACVSYTDAQVGRILTELKQQGLDKNTIVILWGDHGWSLGDHSLWCKHSTFNVAMQTPLILHVPGKKGGKRITALTEFVDIYPSLCELAGLPKPGHLQGDSFVPFLKKPKASGKEAIYARWISADAIKTERYLFTEWFDDDGNSTGRMLYDHKNDPKETVNIAEQPAQEELVEKFSKQLRERRAGK